MQSGVIGGRIGASIAQRWVRNHGLKGAYIRSGIGCLAFAFLMQLVFSVAPPDDPSNHRAGVILVVSLVVMGVGSFVAAFRARHLGFLNGRHHSRWDGRVRRLIRDGDLREAETLLRQMIAAAQTEGRSRASSGWEATTTLCSEFSGDRAVSTRKPAQSGSMNESSTMLARYRRVCGSVSSGWTRAPRRRSDGSIRLA